MVETDVAALASGISGRLHGLDDGQRGRVRSDRIHLSPSGELLPVVDSVYRVRRVACAAYERLGELASHVRQDRDSPAVLGRDVHGRAVTDSAWPANSLRTRSAPIRTRRRRQVCSGLSARRRRTLTVRSIGGEDRSVWAMSRRRASGSFCPEHHRSVIFDEALAQERETERRVSVPSQASPCCRA